MIDIEWALAYDGADWEDEICLLLQCRHGANNVQRVPATDRGDLGLDAFCLTDGAVYQCFAPQRALSLAERLKRHRKKMSEDVQKFIDNADRISKLLGNLKVPRWIFVVPLADSKELLLHAACLSELVRAAKLPFVSPDFQIQVQDAHDFEAERREALRRGIQELSIKPDEADLAQAEEWANENMRLARNMEVKLQAVHPGEDAGYISERTHALIQAYIEGQNVLTILNVQHPEIWEQVQSEIQRTERRLVRLGKDGSAAASLVLRRELNELATKLTRGTVLLSESTADDISMGTVADWLMRCPLDFPRSA
ncbi:MAG TPA: hypothetical protein VHG28_13280 [Longimicrobiaceae bacterium]|nr:hypothetical protein [Longimicrobiaceae bacterium]